MKSGTPGRVAVVLLGLMMGAGCEVRRPEPPASSPSLISLHDAVRADDRAALALHRAAGTDINLRDPDGATALHIAAFHGLHEVVDLLVAWGADVNAVDALGRTPLHLAVLGNHASVVRRLIAADANLNFPDANGEPAIQTAQRLRYDKLYNLLLAAGAEVDFAPEVQVALVESETPGPATEQPAPPPAPKVRTPGNYQIWNSAAGVKMEAEFVEMVLDTVILRTPEDQRVQIGIHRLQGPDQMKARELAGQVASRPAPPTPAAPVTAVPRPEKTTAGTLGPRIGKQGGWTVLENCTLMANASNDGDSFHVYGQNKEHIFRLYMVDSPETSMSFPDRVKEQARYFGLKPAEALHIGKAAAQFTQRVLGSAPFTVATKWEDARGASALPRFYAVVTTPQGDLDELLVGQGYARIYGMPLEGMLGSQKRQQLKNQEDGAKRSRSGAWARKKTSKEPLFFLDE